VSHVITPKERAMNKFAFITLLLFCFNGMATAADKLAIGYVNLHTAVLESKVGKRNTAEIEKLIKEKESFLSGEKSKLQAIDQAFQKDQLLMTDSQKQAKQKEFQDKIETYQKMVATAKQSIDKKQNEFASKSIGEIKTIIAALAKEMKLSIVFDVNELSVLYAEEGMDLTKKVIEKYDAKSK
jgi:outer membrane protein